MRSTLDSILGTSNLDYHSDRLHLSSSSIKCVLKSPEEYFAKYILKQHQNESRTYFDEGSFVHSLILEPEKVNDYAIFPGLRKAGAAWEAFKDANLNKICLSAPQVLRCERLVKSYKRTAAALELIKDGLPEHNMTSSILGVPVKARADYIVPQRNIIIDVKTTSMPSGREYFETAIAEYHYELSAALYCQIAHDTYGSLFDFYWLVLSKEDEGCRIYKASSETLSRGTSLYTRGLVTYKQCLASGIWESNQKQSTFNSEEIEEI